MGFPPATDEAFMVDYEFEHYGLDYGFGLHGNEDPFPFGVPKRVTDERRKNEDLLEQLYRCTQRPKRVVHVDRCMASDFPAVRECLQAFPAYEVIDPHGTGAAIRDELQQRKVTAASLARNLFIAAAQPEEKAIPC